MGFILHHIKFAQKKTITLTIAIAILTKLKIDFSKKIELTGTREVNRLLGSFVIGSSETRSGQERPLLI